MRQIAIIATAFHKTHMDTMLEAARSSSKDLGLNIAQEVWVPGCLETPLAVKRLLRLETIDGVVVLGIIERGETKHGMVMGKTVINALIQLQLEHMKPIGIGILGPDILPDQIAPRLKPYAKGAVEALSDMLRLENIGNKPNERQNTERHPK